MGCGAVYSVSYRVQGVILIVVLVVFLIVETAVTNANAQQWMRQLTSAGTAQASTSGAPEIDADRPLTDDLFHDPTT